MFPLRTFLKDTNLLVAIMFYKQNIVVFSRPNFHDIFHMCIDDHFVGEHIHRDNSNKKASL